MQPENSIEVCNVTKSFKVYFDKGHTLKEKFIFTNSSKYEVRKVLNGISFSVKKGEAVGLIGHNGCGKSTTLKLLTRIMYPDTGTIAMSGRVSSLIELGAGFHPDMSGRQNIYINASIFGLTRKEIDERLDTIIDFSELRDYIDNPVRTYSSGMYMRLAFAVAINVDADILLIDEILAVGDANFQEKCFRKLKEIKKNGTTIVIVSHSLSQIEKICDKCIWIQDGEVRAIGAPIDVDAMYMDFMRVKALENEVKAQKKESGDKSSKQDGEHSGEGTDADQPEGQNEPEINPETVPGSGVRTGNHKVFVSSIRILDKDRQETKILRTGEKAYIEVNYSVKEAIRDVAFRWNIYRIDSVQCFATNTRFDNIPKFDITEAGQFVFEIEALELLPGEYLGDFRMVCGEEDENVDFISKALQFVVGSSYKAGGMVNIRHKWVINGE